MAAASTDESMMPTTRLRRFCFALDLKDDPELIERYRWWHRPGGPPAAVTRGLRAADIREIEIWLRGSRLFMLLEAGPNYDPAAKAARDAQDPDVLAWERLMWELQQPLPGAAPGEKWVPAERIYVLSEQPGL
ncbi:MAG TPA: L-rhamnose mutarotase [Steroidobacteraceae bacterium]|nr:L-rhamnose mutarotase [Steroidobacteraceae bacterium]